MTVRTAFIANLPASLFALVGTSFKVAEKDIYFDSRTRYSRTGTEILLRWGGRSTEELLAGRVITSAVDIELFVATTDKVIDPDLRIEAKIEAAALAIVENYDNSLETLTTMLGFPIDSVRCFEKSSVDIFPGDPDDSRTKYVQHIALEVSAWED